MVTINIYETKDTKQSVVRPASTGKKPASRVVRSVPAAKPAPVNSKKKPGLKQRMRSAFKKAVKLHPVSIINRMI